MTVVLLTSRYGPVQMPLLRGIGTYRQISGTAYKESIERNIHLPMLDNKDNILEFEMGEEV